jgi:uncharacterized protein YbjT (DUF2867 family)
MNAHDPPTVLIIGATGGIGSALVRELANDSGPDKVRVRAAVRRPEAAETLQRVAVETAQSALFRRNRR